jgi:hypothetical protein
MTEHKIGVTQTNEIVHPDTLLAELLQQRTEKALAAIDDALGILENKTLPAAQKAYAILSIKEAKEYLEGNNDREIIVGKWK